MSFIIKQWRAARRMVGLLRSLPGPARMAAIGRLLEPAAARRRRLADVIATDPERLVLVCHGNIMRSAFAVAYLHQGAPDRAARVVGAGTHAQSGRAAQDSAIRVAPEFGVSLAAHTATPLDAVGLGAGDVIICMDRANEATIVARYGSLAGRVFLIGDVATSDGAPRFIADPYARGDAATRVAFQQIVEHAPRWLAVIRA